MSGDPLTMMLFSTVANSALQGLAYKSAGNANKLIANANAQTLTNQAINARAKKTFDANVQRKKSVSSLARGKVGFLKGNVALTGSPVEVLGEAAADFELQAKTTEYGGELDALSFERQAEMTDYGGRVASWKASRQSKFAFAGAGISLIGAGYSSGKIPPITNPFSGMMSSPTLPSTGNFGGGMRSNIGFTLPVDISA